MLSLFISHISPLLLMLEDKLIKTHLKFKKSNINKKIQWVIAKILFHQTIFHQKNLHLNSSDQRFK